MSKIKSQKALDEVEVVDSVSHWMSGKLKSPTTIMSVDWLDRITSVRFNLKLLHIESFWLGGR